MFIGVYEWIREKKVPKWLFFGSAAAFLFVAAFFAWQDEYTSADWRGNRISHLEEQLRQITQTQVPNLTAEIGSVAVGTYRGLQGQVLVVVGMEIANHSGAPSGATDFKMHVELDDSQIIQGTVPLLPVGDLKMPMRPGKPEEIVLKRDDYLPIKASQVIGAGSVVEGWFWSVYPTIAKPNDLYVHKAIVVVEFNDVVTGKLHVVKGSVGKAGFHFPGEN